MSVFAVLGLVCSRASIRAVSIWLSCAVLISLVTGSSATASLVSSFQAGSGGWQLGSPTAGNIDSDGGLEILAPYRNELGLWYLGAWKWNGQTVPGFPYFGAGQPINTSPTLYDLDGDGQNEIIFTQGNSVTALNGKGNVIWTYALNSLNYIPDGGFMAATNGFYWSTDGSWKATLPLGAQFFSEVSPPIVADVDGDGKLEVITAWKIKPDPLNLGQDFNPLVNDYFGLTEWGATGETWSGGVLIQDALTGQKKFIYHFHQLVESGLVVGPPEPDQSRYIYVLNDSDSVVAFNIARPPGFMGKGMLLKMFGKNQRLLSGSYEKGVDLALADLRGDGKREVLVPSAQLEPNWQPSETVLDSDGAILWRQWKEPLSFQNQFGWLNSASMIPVNPDHDNHLDLLSWTTGFEVNYRYWDGVNFVNHPGWPKNFAPFLPTPPLMGDVDGDGVEEIIIATYNPSANPSNGSILIYSLAGELKQEIPISGGVKAVPFLADVNNDGSAELVVRGLDGKISIYNLGAKPSSAVSWAGHRGNAQHDSRAQLDLYPPGTPKLTSKTGGYNEAQFSWVVPPGFDPLSLRIWRSESPQETFALVQELPGSVRQYDDLGLKSGVQYIYEIEAVYSTGSVRSAPIPILSFLNNNLIANGGMEENDNSHWDKWFTGDIPWSDMTASSSAYQGRASMEIKLENQGNNSSISQYSHYGVPESYLPVTPGKYYSFGGFLKSTGISQTSQHWLEWDSAPTGEHPERRPPLPWPFYFTPALYAPAGSATPWEYQNRVFQMPPGFFNVELRHRYTISQSGSGSVLIDNVFFRELPDPTSSIWTDLLPMHSRWRYQSQNPPQNWFQPGFDDSSWPEGQAKLGAGTGPQNIVTPLPVNQPNYYFRKTFTMDDRSYNELLLTATCTDDYGGVTYPMQLYLNGNWAPSTGVEAVSGEGNVIKYFDLTPFLNFLHPGVNTIAVILANTWQSDWDNIAFDVGLKAVARPVQAGAGSAQFTHITAQNGQLNIGVTASLAGAWRIEYCENFAESTGWQLLQQVNCDAGVEARALDQIQSAQKVRFYRLRPAN